MKSFCPLRIGLSLDRMPHGLSWAEHGRACHRDGRGLEPVITPVGSPRKKQHLASPHTKLKPVVIRSRMHVAGHCTVDVCTLVGAEWGVSHCQPRAVSSVGVVGSCGYWV